MQFMMRWLIALICISVCYSLNAKEHKRSFINPYPRYQLYNDGDDPGEPLFLTPLIENKTIPREKIQILSRVVGSQFHGVESYSGYLTVNKNFNSSMFFWYFPALENQAYAPVLLWLQGGPGASSMYGLFTENGPFEVDEHGHLQLRNYTWSRTHNLIYIDNPVGTGFSFTEEEAGYAKNEKDVGRDLHEAMMQLYELFEWSQSADFWISGESYAGKYVPALAYHIHKVQNSIDARVHIPLKGIAIGNGLSDPLHQLKYGDYLYQLGLIDDHGLEQFHAYEKKGADCIEKRDMDCAFDVFDGLINGDLVNGSLFRNLTGFDFYYNYLRTKNDGAGERMATFLQSSATRRAIHVGNKTFHDTDKVNQVELHLKRDVMDSVANWITELLDTYIVCIYNGQLDIIVAYPLTRNYLQHLEFSGSDAYKSAKRDIWYVDGEVAGYSKHAGRLIEIMVRNAGHMAPADQPKWLYWMIDHLTHYKKDGRKHGNNEMAKPLNENSLHTKDHQKRSFINPYPRYQLFNDGDDPGEPLFLTPLIEDKKKPREKIQNVCRVVGSQFHGVNSYAGYLTVNKQFNSNMFFWYFPALENSTHAPVLLWLQGGPGASSMYGLFTENGPFEVDEHGHLQLRNYTWSRTHNLIYIDNPVGTGFSFTEDDAGYAKNEKEVGRDLHEAMMQLYELFEWSQSTGFWISGESYAGKYIPALAYHIHKAKNAVETRVEIPLKGVAIGNGFSDPLHQLKYGDYLYQLGLIDEHGLEKFHYIEKKGAECIKAHDMDCAFDTLDALISGDLSNGSLFHNLTGFDFYYNYLKTKGDGGGDRLATFLQSAATRRAIHVGNKTFHDTDEVNQVELHLKRDVMDTVAPWIAELLDTNQYVICIYNGQLDIIVAYPLTRNFLQQLKFKAADAYKKAERQVWYVDGEVAGYAKHAGRLIEIMVRDAGHMAPADQPKWMYWMIDHLTHYKKYVKRN